MIRDITLGQYYPVDSVIHRLDPRVKLIATLAFVISLFLFKNFIGYIVVTIFLAGVIKLSKVPLKFMLKGLKAIFILMLVMVIFNLIFTPGDPIFKIWIITVTWQGLRASVFMMIRLAYLVIGASIMTLTTTPNRLTDGLEKLLWPLNKLHIPVHEIAMMMSIALRFIPILVEETDKIMKAQMARGANFENGNIFQKAKSLVPVLVPLFVSAFRRANDLAMAMEARCYQGGNGRTKMKPLIYHKNDKIAYLILIIYLIATFLVGRYAPIHIGGFQI